MVVKTFSPLYETWFFDLSHNDAGHVTIVVFQSAEEGRRMIRYIKTGMMALRI